MHPSYYYRAHACVLVRVRCAPSRSRDVGVSRWWWWWWCVCQAFDVTRKSTYQHLSQWYKELRTYCENIPVVLVANKIDVDYKVCVWLFGCVCGAWQHQWVGASITMAHHSRWVGQVTKKKFNFSKKHKLPFFFVSAADGTNVVKMFQEAIKMAWQYKQGSTDFLAEVMELLDDVRPALCMCGCGSGCVAMWLCVAVGVWRRCGCGCGCGLAVCCARARCYVHPCHPRLMTMCIASGHIGGGGRCSRQGRGSSTGRSSSARQWAQRCSIRCHSRVMRSPR